MQESFAALLQYYTIILLQFLKIGAASDNICSFCDYLQLLVIYLQFYSNIAASENICSFIQILQLIIMAARRKLQLYSNIAAYNYGSLKKFACNAIIPSM